VAGSGRAGPLARCGSKRPLCGSLDATLITDRGIDEASLKMLKSNNIKVIKVDPRPSETPRAHEALDRAGFVPLNIRSAQPPEPLPAALNVLSAPLA
jgi:hypothetical protein